MIEHHYRIKTEWTGNEGSGTSNYKNYNRNHVTSGLGKSHEILLSSEPAFRGDKERFNPEELLVSAISSCHMLWYLHLCAINQVVLISYIDDAKGIMTVDKGGSGKFKEVCLYPKTIVANESMVSKAIDLHQEANKMCFIANSCNFPILHKPEVQVESI